MNSGLIRRSAVKKFALAASQKRCHRFTRVADGFADRCEAVLRRFINEHVHRLPSVGKTIR